ADLGEDRAQPVDGVAIEYPAAIFRYKDQMDMHLKNAVSSMPNIVVVSHRPNYNIRMQRLQAFKYELMPTCEQERNMRRFAGSCRFVYNKGLALQKERYERGEKKLGYARRAVQDAHRVAQQRGNGLAGRDRKGVGEGRAGV